MGKKKPVKMSLNEFIGGAAATSTSWADDDLPTAPAALSGDAPRASGFVRGTNDRDLRPKPEDIPTRGPFTAYVGNLPFDVTERDLEAFFTGCNILSIRIPMNHETQRPKGYCYVEFKERDSLIKGLDHHGKEIRNRALRINLAEQKENNDDKTHGSWRRQGGSSYENEAPKPADTSSSWRRTGPPPVRENGFAPLASEKFRNDGLENRGVSRFSQADTASNWRNSGSSQNPSSAFGFRRNDTSAPLRSPAPTSERKKLVLQPRSKPLE